MKRQNNYNSKGSLSLEIFFSVVVVIKVDITEMLMTNVMTRTAMTKGKKKPRA